MGSKRQQLLEAEMSVLGALLLDPSRLPTVTELVRAEDFVAEARHKTVFEAITELAAAGEAVDEVTVTSHMRSTGRASDDVGLYLSHLVERTPTAANVATYASILARRAAAKRVYVAVRDAMRKLDEGEDQDEVMAEVTAAVDDARRREPRRFVDAAVVARDVVAKVVSKAEGGDGEVFVPTGLADLDHALGGLTAGLYCIGARPRMGKTALAIKLADHIADVGGRCAFFSAEMMTHEIIRRSVARRGRIRYKKMRINPRELSGEEWARMMRLKADFPRESFWVDDASPITMAEVHARAKRQHEKSPLSCVIVDYLQKVAPPANKYMNREQQVAQTAREAKDIVKDLRIPVVVLAQLNRGKSEDPGARTTDRDFRESDAIFAESDVVMAIKRPIVWDQDADPREATIEIIKYREGEESDVRVDFEGWCVNFCDHDPMKAKEVRNFSPPPPSGSWLDD